MELASGHFNLLKEGKERVDGRQDFFPVIQKGPACLMFEANSVDAIGCVEAWLFICGKWYAVTNSCVCESCIVRFMLDTNHPACVFSIEGDVESILTVLMGLKGRLGNTLQDLHTHLTKKYSYLDSATCYDIEKYMLVKIILTEDVFKADYCPSWANYAYVNRAGNVCFRQHANNADREYVSSKIAHVDSKPVYRPAPSVPEYTMEELVDKLGHNFKLKKGD